MSRVYIYIYTHTYIHTYIHIYIYIYIYIRTCVCIYIYTYVWIHTYNVYRPPPREWTSGRFNNLDNTIISYYDMV